MPVQLVLVFVVLVALDLACQLLRSLPVHAADGSCAFSRGAWRRPRRRRRTA
jgi:hypothetical protein